MSFVTAEHAIHDIQHGKMVILCDDESRENEGGLICLTMLPERLDQLGLPLMVEHPNALHGTAFTFSIDAIDGVSTGISSADRVAGLRPAGVICEIMNADGSMARRLHLEHFAAIYRLHIVTIADLV
jgi:3,4-dihydroxy 2-butanone 4-phosphate synthase/GTP cyclohydrolase II